MGKSAVLLLVLALVTWGIVAFLPVNAEPRKVTVPDDYSTISAAVAGVGEGGTIFVKKGTYHEQTLEIDKPLFLLGEDVDETTINFDPPLVNAPILGGSVLVHSTAISIRASDVRLSGFTINLADDDYGCIDGLSATGDRIEIVGNIIGEGLNLNLNGTLLSVVENSVSSGLQVHGSNQTIERNLINALTSQGACGRIVENTVNGPLNLYGFFNLVVGNSFSAMYLENSDSNFICNNTLGCLWIGSNGLGCSGNTVCKNRVTGPGNWGILMGAGSYNVFHDNLISNYAGGYGLAIGGNSFSAEYNVFYRNIFLNNSRHVGANWEILGAGNYWDNGEEGNYWDDYKGRDDDGDGVGDAPYVVEGCKWDDAAGGLVEFIFGQDSYPLMAPFDIDSVIVELPEWASSSSDSLPEPEVSETFPSVPILAASVAAVAVGAGLLVYFKKLKRQAATAGEILTKI